MSTVERMEAFENESDRRFADQSPAERDAAVAPERLRGLPPKYYATVHGVETLAALKAALPYCETGPIREQALAAIAKAEGRQR